MCFGCGAGESLDEIGMNDTEDFPAGTWRGWGRGKHLGDDGELGGGEVGVDDGELGGGEVGVGDCKVGVGDCKVGESDLLN